MMGQCENILKIRILLGRLPHDQNEALFGRVAGILFLNMGHKNEQSLTKMSIFFMQFSQFLNEINKI
jgi:hypothetical protein